jgi:hypothetical protein
MLFMVIERFRIGNTEQQAQSPVRTHRAANQGFLLVPHCATHLESAPPQTRGRESCAPHRRAKSFRRNAYKKQGEGPIMVNHTPPAQRPILI